MILGKWHLGLHMDKLGDFKHHPSNQGFDYFYGLTGTNIDDFGKETKVVTSVMPYWYWQLFSTWLVTTIALWCLFREKYFGVFTFMFLLFIWSIPVTCVYLLFDNYILLTSFVHRNFELVEQPIRLPGLCQRLMKEGMEFIQNATSTGQPFMAVMSWVHMHAFLSTGKNFEGRSEFGRYGDALEELDWSVGEILTLIKDLGLEDNTLVYFTSDNGGHLEIGKNGGYNGILKGTFLLFFHEIIKGLFEDVCLYVCLLLLDMTDILKSRRLTMNR